MPRKVEVPGLKIPAYGPRHGKMVPLDIGITREIPGSSSGGRLGLLVRDQRRRRKVQIGA